MVRWPSSVISTWLRAVGAPSAALGSRTSTPSDFMSWLKMRPSWSSRTLPMYADVPPRLAKPATVFATEPPDISVAGPILL